MTLFADPDYAVLQGIGYRIGVRFDLIRGPYQMRVSSGGGNDTAVLLDSPADDLFVATPTYAGFVRDSSKIELDHFASVKVNAVMGGTDVAKLFDSPGDDLFVGKADYGACSGNGFNNEVYGFDGVHAYATAGGVDLAKLFDSPGDDTFYADPVQGGALRPGEFYNRAKFFEGVHAYATGGGRDVAQMFGSAGSDLFAGTPESSALFGTGYYNRAKYFDEVFSDLSQGGDDRVLLEDSAEVDTFRLSGRVAELTAGGRRLYRVEGLDSDDIVCPIDTHHGNSDRWVYPLYQLDLHYWPRLIVTYD